jgi:hypothetical protein
VPVDVLGIGLNPTHKGAQNSRLVHAKHMVTMYFRTNDIARPQAMKCIVQELG